MRFPKIQARREQRSLGKEWVNLLRQYPSFSSTIENLPFNIDFSYSSSSDENLQKLRETYRLDDIAGQGSELDKIINLMTWVYLLTQHANEPAIPTERNALSFIHMVKNENRATNCFMKTVILNEIYLAMGFLSRCTHLLPHSKEEEESHFITSVFSHTLDKWILMDPDFGVYVKDRKGNILGVSEIRKGLIEESRMKVVHTGRRLTERMKLEISLFLTKIDYFWFLSTFIFKIRCPKISEFNQYSKTGTEQYELLPENYKDELIHTSQITEKGRKIFFVNDESLFWRKPTES